MKNLIIGIGPARCMTTWFIKQFESNLEVYIPSRKEVRLLNKIDFDTIRYKKILLDHYRNVSLEYSNDYSLNIDLVRKNIDKLKLIVNINVKYIFLFRNPEIRFLSHIELLARRLNINYTNIPKEKIKECLDQSMYSIMVKEIDLSNTLLIDMDRIKENKHFFEEKIMNYFEISKFECNFEKNHGKSFQPRIMIIDTFRQKIFNYLDEHDYDNVIKYIKKIKLTDLLKYFNHKNSISDRDQMKIYFKKEISYIKKDFEKFNLLRIDNII